MNKPIGKQSEVLVLLRPCSKRPGWSLDALSNAFLGRSHRAKIVEKVCRAFNY